MTQSANPYLGGTYGGGPSDAQMGLQQAQLWTQLNANTVNLPQGSYGNPQANSIAAGATPYGGYAGGFRDTRNQLLQQQAAAAGQAAPSANFGRAQGYLGQTAGVQNAQNANIAALGQQANQLRGIANGGQTAADTAFNQAQRTGAAAQQSMAAGAAPGAAYSAAQRGAAANQGYAAQQGVGQKQQLDFQQQMAAQQQLAQVQQQQAAALQGARGLAQQRVQGAQGMAEFNPQMQQQQNALNAGNAQSYNNALLSMQQQAQEAGLTSGANENAYQLGTQGMSIAQQGLAIGAIGSAGGAGLSALGSTNPYGGGGGSASQPYGGSSPLPYGGGW